MLADLALDVDGRTPGVDDRHVLLALEDLHHRPGPGVVFTQADLERLGVVVRAGQQLAAADVAGVRHPGAAGDEVVVQPASGAQASGQHPSVDLLVRQVQVDHSVDVVAFQEEFGLPGVTGETVDDETVVPVVTGEPVPDHRLDQVVTDQMAAGDDAFDLGAQFGMALHVPAKNVTHADMDEIKVVGEHFRLRALAAALHAHDDELAHTHLRLPEISGPQGFPVTCDVLPTARPRAGAVPSRWSAGRRRVVGAVRPALALLGPPGGRLRRGDEAAGSDADRRTRAGAFQPRREPCRPQSWFARQSAVPVPCRLFLAALFPAAARRPRADRNEARPYQCPSGPGGTHPGNLRTRR